MLHLRSNNNYANVFAINVFSSLYASTIGASSTSSRNVQYTRTSNLQAMASNHWYIRLINQLTSKEYWGELGEIEFGIKNLRSKSFFLFLDDYVEKYHINITDDGLYNYEIYNTNQSSNVIFEEEGVLTALVHTGMAMVHNANFVNDYFQNSTNGVEKMIIPNAVSYNG